MTLAARPAREPALDGLRGVAILLVLLFHSVTQVYAPAHPVMDILRRIAALGGCGVDLFFVLSGFLIGRILFQHREAANLYGVFYARRACRIVPAYLLLLASFLVAREVDVLAAVGDPVFFSSTVPFWSYVVFLQNNFMAIAHSIGPWWLVVTWSLAVEEQFYLVAPVLRRCTIPFFCGLAGIVFLLSPIGRWWMVTEAANPAGAIYLTLLRLEPLVIGVLLAALDQAGKFQARLPAWARAGLVLWPLAMGGSLLAGPVIGSRLAEQLTLTLGPGVNAIGFGALLLWVRCQPASAVSRLLGRPWLVGFGSLSYFIYLFHLPVTYTLHAGLRHRLPAHLDWSDAFITAAALVLTTALAAASRILLELPFIRLGQRLNYSS